MTVTEGADKINAAGCEWINANSRYSIETITRRAAKGLSKNSIFNLAAYLKYEFPSMTGMEDADWLDSAKQAQKILGEKA
jgi:hypothetical protein